MLNILHFGRNLGMSSLWQQQKIVVTLATRFYKSDLSLENLYPNSKQKLFTPACVSCATKNYVCVNLNELFQPAPSKEAFNGVIPLDKIQITYDKASGPGGMNVNKVNTKVDLRFNVNEASWLSDAVKARLGEDVRTITCSRLMRF